VGDGDELADGRESCHASHAISWRLRTTLLAALVVDMVVKTDGAITLLALFTLLGAAWSVPPWLKRNTSPSA
jgi:hypothetical protein